MVAAAAIGAVATVGGAVVSSSAASKASKAATSAANTNNALQSQIYNENKATLAPYVAAGQPATDRIQALLGLGGDAAAASAGFDAFKGSDGYQFRFNEGQKAVTAALGGRGLLDSGAAQKALQKYGQNTASAEFGNYLGYLGNQQALGLSAASAQAGVGQNYAGAVGANNNAAANAVGNAALTNANIINGSISGVLGAYGLSQGLGSSYGGGGRNAYGVLGGNIY